MNKIYKSPETIYPLNTKIKSIFLAGSIEMDKAIDWQKLCESKLAEKYVIFNPRRESWDSSWQQSIDNEPFNEQVNWELDALEKADIILMFFAANTKSPISLLEFGLYAKTGKLRVVVEDDFWRKGNIDIVCKKYGIAQYESLKTLIVELMKNENTNT